MNLAHLNEFKSFENLKLNGFDLEQKFELKINRLKTLDIEDCSNIYLKEDKNIHLKSLKISDFGQFSLSKSLLKLPKLEYLSIIDHKIIEDDEYELPFDLKSLISLKKLLVFNGMFKEVQKLPSLEYLEYIDFFGLFKSTFEKIVSMKTLKEVTLDINGILDLDGISKIKAQNISITKLTFHYFCKNNCKQCDISDLQNKFPNVSDLNLVFDFYNKFSSEPFGENPIKIEENPNCKINKISLKVTGREKITFYCQPFGSLEKIEIIFRDPRIHLIDISYFLPMFKSNSEIVYKSLVELNLNFGFSLSLKEFKNLSNSINNMPNLKKFFLYFNLDKISRKDYEKFIRKLLSLNLEIIKINTYILYDEVYSFKELQNINKNINSLSYENIKIKRYKKINYY